MLPAKSFYLIRHGESTANRAEISAGGGTDSPLTDKGQQQARTLAPYLEDLEVKPGALYHSPMLRAYDTAMLLNKGIKLAATEKHNLHEHHLGEWEGRPWAEIGPLLDNGQNPPGGETEAQFSQRIQSVFTDILEQEDDPPLIVAHGGLFHALGLLYEYGMAHVNNCHLHYFEPYPAFDHFPWRVWQFDINGEEDKLTRSPAPFCLSQALHNLAS